MISSCARITGHPEAEVNKDFCFVSGLYFSGRPTNPTGGSGCVSQHLRGRADPPAGAATCPEVSGCKQARQAHTNCMQRN
jgi:hypothetical protein